ncbi:MAG: hypothetical protein GY795_50220 [Desulfobacterales bacterium]|nr:hypothetical protein [Desulfobacterales bacterium]
MAFTRKFKQSFAIVCIIIWMHLDVYAVYAAAQQASSLKTTPNSYHAESPAGEPEPDEGVENLFDRDIHTSYAPSGTALIDVNLDSVQTVSEIRIYGPSSYILTVQEQVNGQWLELESPKDLDLSALSDQWHRYETGKAVETDALRLQLVPIADTDNSQGISEIEFWSPGQHEPVRSGKALLALMDEGTEVRQGRRYQAEPETGVIGPDEGEYVDYDNDNVFHFDLAFQPAQIKRAYLSYDLSGLAHWTGVIRSINDQAAMGGYVIEHGEGGPQVEAVAPEWLRQGTNLVRFVPVSDDETYKISNVQVLIELDNGANFVSSVRSNMGNDSAAVAGLYDGDISTGLEPEQKQEFLNTGWERRLWQEPSDSQDIDGAVAELGFDRLTDLTAIGFYATGKLKGRIMVILQKHGEWVESAATGEHNLNKEGWYYLNIHDGEEAQGARLVFDNTAGNAEISEIRAVGSNLGAGDEPVISISYPDAGQFFGDNVYIRGFATPDNGSGQARLYAGEQEIFHVSGEFETVVNEETAGENGVIQLTALYPDGETIVSLIPLLEDRLEENDQIEIRDYRNQSDGEEADNGESEYGGIYNDVNLIEDFRVTGEKDHKLDFKGAKVEMGKGALRKAVKIRMMTLRDRDLPALDAGMVNVTGKFKGFRFLPHGMKFDKKVKIKLPYNKQLIPEGFKDEDVRPIFLMRLQAGGYP